ncbi:MAG: formate/nitrite transporter family protein, partial [Sedimentisphaerales bacterium]|nr:formate/nitrite transporter family protein [Sedimentisphaerales bacterium]
AYFIKAVYCNAMVCLAVWLCFSARTSTDKILCIIFPIAGFVASGFEHCVANMYFIPVGLFIKDTVGATADNLTWVNFFKVNLLPVTLGNIVGGAGYVGVFYWIIYSRKKKA